MDIKEEKKEKNEKNEKEEKEEQLTKPKVSTKDELILNIKEWIKMDNDINKLKSEVKDKTNKKKRINRIASKYNEK